MSTPSDDLTEGWPPDADNEELARFAEELRASRPTLPDESLTWIEQTVQQELACPPEPSSHRAWYAGLTAAAALLIGTGLYFWMKPPPAPVDPPPVVEQPPARVEDRYNVEMAAPPMPVKMERSLVRLDEHRSLFTD